MVKKASAKRRRKAKPSGHLSWRQRVRRRVWQPVLAGVAVLIFAILIFTVLNPPTTLTMRHEAARLGRAVEADWVPLETIAPVMARSVVAAEDANFCLHWGFDMQAIRTAIEGGGVRGASTLSQQTVKNVYLWQGRSWFRKALEAILTPIVEMVWSKRRIIEVYQNVAEFGEGVFGVEAAAQKYFGVKAAKLTARQAALLAAVLPAPRSRSASKPSDFVSKRAVAIADGAATIHRDGRSSCFED